MSGIFVLQGMAISIPQFSLSLDESGKISSELSLHLGYDACIAWARIALNHRNEALSKIDQRRVIWAESAPESDLRGTSLEEEFFAAVQALTAAAFCIDAFYDHLNRCAPLPKYIREAWLRKKTARYKQIAETMRTAFRLTPADGNLLRFTLKALFTLRDRIVHPSSVPMPPQPHPEIGASTEWRFSVYRGDVADTIVSQIIGLLWDLTRFTKFRSEEIAGFMEGFKTRLDRLLPDGRPVARSATVNYFLPHYPTRPKP